MRRLGDPLFILLFVGSACTVDITGAPCATTADCPTDQVCLPVDGGLACEFGSAPEYPMHGPVLEVDAIAGMRSLDDDLDEAGCRSSGEPGAVGPS
jgi:hypothetical protein